MDEVADLEWLLRRLLAGTASEAERQTLREARLSLATGERAVAISGNVTDTVIVTGDGNVVLVVKGDAAAVRQAFLALYPARLRQLPADLPDFTGREVEVEKLLRLFFAGSDKAAISALGGMGGVGKTVLAMHVAHKLAEHYPEGQIVVDLTGTSETPLSPAAAMGRVINAFETQARLPESPEDVAALYRSVLAGRRALLLLDNAANGAQIKDLLPPPPAAALITSRRAISLSGLTSLNLDVLAAAEAEDLLRSILRERRATDQEITALADRCGRLPLALRIAGSFLAIHTDWKVGEYLEALAQEKERLWRLKHEDLDVEAVLGLSAVGLARENMEWAERWQMLTVFPASFDRAGAAVVWQVTEEEARDVLSELLIRSLVLYDSETGRYRLHDLMRLVARNAFGYGGGETDAVADHQARMAQAAALHAEHYVEILREANALYLQGGKAMGQGLQLFDEEWDNLRAGQAWAAVNAERDKAAVQLCSAYTAAGVFLLSLRLHPRERIAWLEPALAAARRFEDRTAEGTHLGNLGNAYYWLGEYRRALEYHEQALAISREIGDCRGEGAALGGLGLAYSWLGEYHRAIKFHKQRLAIAREIGDREGEGTALGNLGLAYYWLGEYRRAIKLHKQRLAIARENGDREGEGNALGDLGRAYQTLGEYRRALEYYEQQLVITRKIGHRRGEGAAVGNLGSVYQALGEYPRAFEYYEQHLVITREIGDRRGEGNALFNMSLALDNLGKRPQAMAQAQEALKIYEQIKSPRSDRVRRQLEAWRQNSSPSQPLGRS